MNIFCVQKYFDVKFTEHAYKHVIYARVYIEEVKFDFKYQLLPNIEIYDC